MFDYENEEFADITSAVGAIMVGEETSETPLIEAGSVQLAIEIARLLPHEIGASSALTVLQAALLILQAGVDYGVEQGDEPESEDLLTIRASVLDHMQALSVEARAAAELETVATTMPYSFSAAGGDA